MNRNYVHPQPNYLTPLTPSLHGEGETASVCYCSKFSQTPKPLSPLLQERGQGVRYINPFANAAHLYYFCIAEKSN